MINMKMYKHILLIGLIGLFATEIMSLKITNLNVPETYIINEDENSEKLILDCEYEIQPNETGFVLKWLFNGLIAYQWILYQKPFALFIFRGRVNTSYEASDEKFYKYRTLVINKPIWNMTGEYTCDVQTFESSQKKSARLQMIVPESDFVFAQKIVDDSVVISCGVENVFPQPKLTIMIDDKSIPHNSMLNKTDDGLFILEIEEKLLLTDLESPTTINCILTLPGTDYSKRKTSVFYDPKTTATTTTVVPDEESSSSSRLEGDPSQNGNSSSQNNPSLIFIISTMFMVILTNLLEQFV